ncbi:unnamed protein product [Amaranthus hypochondriacus]
MYRSGSTTRFSDENLSTSTKLRDLDDADELQLPVYEVSKKQRGSLTLGLPAESVIHVIPVVVLLCAFILWFNSYPTPTH